VSKKTTLCLVALNNYVIYQIDLIPTLFHISNQANKKLSFNSLRIRNPFNNILLFMSKRHLALLSLISVAFLSACSSTKLAETKDVTPKAVEVSAPQAESKVASVVADHLNPNSLISTQRSVYFDYDQYVVKSNDAALVERHGKYLSSKSALVIRVEGNTDERGGREYNLALGQKRADAVVRALKVYGVNDKQVEAVSFGKEKPKADGHDEAAWSQNRRVDLVYPTK
jgi:peptidoglycan-associated lipoprotein